MRKAAHYGVYTKENTSGFTFIELIIAVSIITIIAAAAIPGFNTYIKTQNLRQTAENIKSDIRTAQIRALAGAYSDNPQAKYWALLATDESSNYALYTCPDLTGVNCTQRGDTKTTVGNVLFRNEGEVFFKIGGGEAYSGDGTSPCTASFNKCSFKVGPGDGSCTYVKVNRSGGLVIRENITCN